MTTGARFLWGADFLKNRDEFFKRIRLLRLVPTPVRAVTEVAQAASLVPDPAAVSPAQTDRTLAWQGVCVAIPSIEASACIDRLEPATPVFDPAKASAGQQINLAVGPAPRERVAIAICCTCV